MSRLFKAVGQVRVIRSFNEEREFMLETILRDVPEQGMVKRQTLREMFSNVFTLGWQLGEQSERHKFEGLQRSLSEALNSGDGSYRP